MEYKKKVKQNGALFTHVYEETPETYNSTKGDKKISLSTLTVTTTAGNTFDADDISISAMLSAIIASPVIGITEHNWKLADNTIKLITLTELEEAHALAIQAKGAIILG